MLRTSRFPVTFTAWRGTRLQRAQWAWGNAVAMALSEACNRHIVATGPQWNHDSGTTPLIDAAGVRGSADMLLWLLAKGADAARTNDTSCDALCCAYLAGRHGARRGAAGRSRTRAEPRAEHGQGNRPLHAADKVGGLDIVRVAGAGRGLGCRLREGLQRAAGGNARDDREGRWECGCC